MLMFACALLSLYMLIVIDLFSFSLNRRGWKRFASTFLLFYSQIVITEFTLGLSKFLFSWSLVVLNVVLTTTILCILSRKHGKKLLRQYDANLRSWLTTLEGVKHDKMWLMLLLLALGGVFWILCLGFLFPVTDFDGNSYHLTFIGYLIQNHNLYDFPTSLGWLTGYPKGGELIEAWSMLVAHADTFVDITQLPFLFLGIYGLYETATTLGADKRHARFAALLYAFIPIVLNQLKTSYVDVMLCSLFTAGLAMVVHRKLNKLDLLLVGIIFSLIVSIKSTGFLFVIVLLPLLIWNLYQVFGKEITAYLQPVLLIASPMIFGVYWYVKDYVLYHTPLYPFGYKIAGITLFPGMDLKQFISGATATTALPHSGLQRIWFVWTEQKDWFGCMYNYDTNYAGLGPIWFIVLIPAILISLYFAFRKRNYLFLAVMATVLGLFAIYPADYYARYTMFIVSAGIVALGLTLTYVGKWTTQAIKFLCIVLVLYVIGTNYTLCTFTPATVYHQIKSMIHGSLRGPVYESVPGKAFVFIEARVKPGQTVVYDSSPYFIYPLWTPSFSDKVLYLPASSQEAWYQQLTSRHANYVFTTIGSRENQWCRGHFKETYKDEMYEIFQVN